MILKVLVFLYALMVLLDFTTVGVYPTIIMVANKRKRIHTALKGDG
jgi:hypothetical protein